MKPLADLERRHCSWLCLVRSLLTDITSRSDEYTGEMHFTPSGPDSSFNLPRAGGVAFAVQESWVQNETIRENILFHSPYDEERYKKGMRPESQCETIGTILMAPISSVSVWFGA